MSGIEPLGRLFNLAHTADDVYVNLRDAESATFVCQLDAGDTFTLTEATSVAGAGAQVLPTITNYYTAAKGGTGTWTRVQQASGSTVVTASAVVAVVTVRGEELSDGYSHVKVASTSTGTVMAILHDLTVQRTPANLPAVSA